MNQARDFKRVTGQERKQTQVIPEGCQRVAGRLSEARATPPEFGRPQARTLKGCQQILPTHNQSPERSHLPLLRWQPNFGRWRKGRNAGMVSPELYRLATCLEKIKIKLPKR